MLKDLQRRHLDNEKEFLWLDKFFGDPPAPLDYIEPVHIRPYMEWRAKETVKAEKAKNVARKAAKRAEVEVPVNMGHVRANREKALFSHMWNYARLAKA